MENKELSIWFYNNLTKNLEFLYASQTELGIIKCKFASNGKLYTKNGLRKKKTYNSEKLETKCIVLDEFLKSLTSTSRKQDECNFYLKVNLVKDNDESWYMFDEDYMDIVIEKLSDLFWSEFNEIYYLDFLRPKHGDVCVA